MHLILMFKHQIIFQSLNNFWKPCPVLGMSLRNLTLLGSNLASVTDVKKIRTPHSLCCDFGGYRTFTTRLSGGDFNFESKFELLPVIWQSFRTLFQKVIKGLEGEINGQPLLAALLLCFARVGLASTNTGRFWVDSQAVAASSNRLAWGKHATTLTILTQFKSQQDFNAL